MDDLARWHASLHARLPGLAIPDRLRFAARLRELWPPRNPGAVVRMLETLAREIVEAEIAAAAAPRRLPEPRYPEDLPVVRHRGSILEALARHPVVVLAGETGSGKSTQLPKLLLEVGCGARGRIALTQPRRVAATSVSQRIAEELGVEWGREVGCKIRFADRSSPETCIKVVTDGVLLAELQGDPELWQYDAVMVDEAHERSLNIDFLLGTLRRLRARRPDLRVVVTSATLDTAKFSAAFDGAPVLHVEGRAFPVDIAWRPPEEDPDSDDEDHVAAAATVVAEACEAGEPGDILVFLPGEREIREAAELLAGRAVSRRLGRVEILPLYARLAQGEQARIFARTQARKIILATNVAETSLTIPGVRLVVDAGLARISRYRSGTRTLALPIEPISQASARQRAGRAGRTAPGRCVRLYSEQDFLARPADTPPEIARANLAGVILRMAALGLGRPEDFPFVDPPPERAVAGGYDLLEELGALDERHELTPLGRRLARIPVDPTLARMLVQAEEEGSLAEVLVIAAALSLPDPRERPEANRGSADEAHRKFEHPESDFLTLLNLWRAAFEDPARPGGKGLHRFARDHYLNFVRLREWRDLREQLWEAMRDAGEARLNREPAEYHQVHRALLAGCLGHVARRAGGDAPPGEYRAVRSRTAALFPGSVLAKRTRQRKETVSRSPAQMEARAAKPPALPEWIFCAEWFETTRLMARTAARLDPAWILDLGAHLLRVTHTEPGWDERGCRATCRERRLLAGLVVEEKRVLLTPIDPAEATAIFIRCGLVADTIRDRIPVLEHNRAVVAEAEQEAARNRRGSASGREERIVAFYAARLEAVGCVAELRAWLKANGDERLRLSAADLAEPEADPVAFPASVDLGGTVLPLHYAYRPGEESDGVTLKVPVAEVDGLRQESLDWLVPGHVDARLEALLRCLPKEERRKVFPLAERTAEIRARLARGAGTLEEQVARVLVSSYGVDVRGVDWRSAPVDAWLLPRIEVVDAHGRAVASGRSLDEVRAAVDRVRAERRAAAAAAGAAGEGEARAGAWSTATRRWEREGLVAWDFGDVPASVPVGLFGGVEIEAYPGLKAEPGGVALRLFPDAEAAAKASRAGARALWRLVLGRDLAWWRRDLEKGLGPLRPLLVAFATIDALDDDAWSCAEDALFGDEPCWPLAAAGFAARVERARREAGKTSAELVALVGKVARRRVELATDPAFRAHGADLERIVPPRFLAATPLPWLRRVPTWLEALAKRVEKASRNPPQDREREARVEPWAKAARDGIREALASGAKSRWRAWKEFGFLVEEYRVQVHAQELGTVAPVSPARLETRLAELRRG